MAKDGHVAHFIEPMECLPVEKIPEGDVWTYELKLDGYRVIAVKGSGKVTLYSRRGTDLTQRFRDVAEALASLPDETVIDGEVVALDEQGKPNFNRLQNYRSAESHIMLYAFDVLVRRGENLTKQTLSKRREILESLSPERASGCRRHPSPEPRRFLLRDREINICLKIVQRRIVMSARGPSFPLNLKQFPISCRAS